MNNIYVRILASLSLGALVCLVFILICELLVSTIEALILAMGAGTICTLIFCTFTIIEEIKKNQ